MTSQLLTVPKAAISLGIAASTLYRWIRNGSVEVIRHPNGQIRISMEQVEALRAYLSDSD